MSMMLPMTYKEICQKALDAREKYGLSDIQMFLYNIICQGEVYLFQDDGYKFWFDKMGWGGDRKWVRRQFGKLITEGLVKHKITPADRDRRYTFWYFYCSNFRLPELIDASCYATVNKYFRIKHLLNLPTNPNKDGGVYGDLKFLKRRNKARRLGEEADFLYTFEWKGEKNIYQWDLHNPSKKIHTYDFVLERSNWGDLMHDLYGFMSRDGYDFEMDTVPNMTNKRSEINCCEHVFGEVADGTKK